MRLSAALLLALPAAVTSTNILVFGDSQGDVGPTYKVVEDVLTTNSVTATVENAAEGGTLSCGWAESPSAIADAGRDKFGTTGPDYVWLTVGGNDIAMDPSVGGCWASAGSDADANACLKAASDTALACTKQLLEGLWKEFPNAKVGMYNYEVPDLAGECLEGAAEFLGKDYCMSKAEPIPCMIKLLKYFQSIYVDSLAATYPAPKFTGMNILGACQKASGVPGAEVGSPALTAGTKSEWMISGCVHPKYGTPAATVIGDEMWKQWLQEELGAGGGGDAVACSSEECSACGDGAECTSTTNCTWIPTAQLCAPAGGEGGQCSVESGCAEGLTCCGDTSTCGRTCGATEYICSTLTVPLQICPPQSVGAGHHCSEQTMNCSASDHCDCDSYKAPSPTPPSDNAGSSTADSGDSSSDADASSSTGDEASSTGDKASTGDEASSSSSSGPAAGDDSKDSSTADAASTGASTGGSTDAASTGGDQIDSSSTADASAGGDDKAPTAGEVSSSLATAPVAFAALVTVLAALRA